MATLAREHQDHASWRDYLDDQAAGGGADADHLTGRHVLATRAGVAWQVLIFGNLGIGCAPVRRRRSTMWWIGASIRYGPHPQASRNLGSHLAQCCLRLCSAAGRDWDGTAADLTNELAAWLTLASLLGYAVIYTGFLKRATAEHRDRRTGWCRAAAAGLGGGYRAYQR
jgi:protoheme IX farnesyltransferase